MNLLSICLVQSCNYSCYYCPMKEWLYPLDHKVYFRGGAELQPGLSAAEKEKRKVPINLITNESLLKWLDKYIEPREWMIEMTGGEPGLYSGIGKLVPALCERGYVGLIKTNGSLPIPKSDNFKLVTAWHEGVKDIPPYYDIILIIKNTADDWRRKAAHCEERGIPYKTLPFNRSFEGDHPHGLVTKNNSFLGYSALLSMGQITACPAIAPTEGYDIYNMRPPVIKNIAMECPLCGNVAGFETFLTPYLLGMVQSDYHKRYKVDDEYAVERKARLATLLAVKNQGGWPV